MSLETQPLPLPLRRTPRSVLICIPCTCGCLWEVGDPSLVGGVVLSRYADWRGGAEERAAVERELPQRRRERRPGAGTSTSWDRAAVPVPRPSLGTTRGRARRLVQEAFTPRVVEELRPRCRSCR